MRPRFRVRPEGDQVTPTGEAVNWLVLALDGVPLGRFGRLPGGGWYCQLRPEVRGPDQATARAAARWVADASDGAPMPCGSVRADAPGRSCVLPYRHLTQHRDVLGHCW